MRNFAQGSRIAFPVLLLAAGAAMSQSDFDGFVVPEDNVREFSEQRTQGDNSSNAPAAEDESGGNDLRGDINDLGGNAGAALRDIINDSGLVNRR